MAKKMYVGVSDIARNITKAYVGINNVARKIIKGYVGVNGVAQQFYEESTPVPTGYTFVEYIQSTGTQYINTGVTPNYGYGSNTNYEIELSNDDPSVSKYLFGSRVAYQNAWLVVNYTTESGNTGYSIGFETSRWQSNLTGSGKHKIKLTNGDCNIDNTYSYTFVKNSFSSNLPLYLFAGNNNGSVFQPAFMKLYSCKLYRNNSLIHDFKPAIRNSDSEVGLYDSVTDTFYTNSGTGTFIAGNPI